MAGKTGSREGGGFWPPRATRFRTCTKGTQEVPSIFLVLELKIEIKITQGPWRPRDISRGATRGTRIKNWSF